MFGSFVQGLRYLIAGFGLIRQPGLRRFALMPLAINVAVFAGLGWLVSDALAAYLDSLSWLNATPDTWYGWLIDKLRILIWIFAISAMLVFMGYTFTLLANLIAAPFNSLLAEKVERHLRGEPTSQASDSVWQVVKTMPKVMGAELGKLLYLALWMIPILLLYLIPGLNLAAPLIAFLFSAWMLSLEYVDYPMGNHNYYFRQIRTTMRQHRQLGLGFGSAATVLTMIPLVNLIAMPVAVAGATQLWVQSLHPSSSRSV